MSDVTPPLRGAAPSGAPGAPSPAPPKKGLSTVVIVIGVVALLLIVMGVAVAAIALSGMSRYLANAKVSEAYTTLARLGALAAQARTERGKLCPSASAPVPATVPRGVKYQSSPSDWNADGPDAGFACLGFTLTGPQYFQYSYVVKGDGSSLGSSVEMGPPPAAIATATACSRASR